MLCFQQNGGGLDGLGQVSYEESGEFFFLPFSSEDVEGMMRLRVADQISFSIARDKRYVRLCRLGCRIIQKFHGSVHLYKLLWPLVGK